MNMLFDGFVRKETKYSEKLLDKYENP